MKKIILILVSLVLIIVSVIAIKYNLYMIEKNNLNEANKVYEQYKDKETYGIDLATLINKTIDENEKNLVEKDKNNLYASNEENSIEIEIYMNDTETTYKMEKIHDLGTEQFVQFYGNIKFKCSNIEYHKKSGRVKYMLFEQI